MMKNMIYYKITYYSNDFCFGGQFLEFWQLKYIKNIVDFYFEAFNLKELNIRVDIIEIKSNEYEIQNQKRGDVITNGIQL